MKRSTFRTHEGWPQLATELRLRWHEENRPCLICGERPRNEQGQLTEFSMQDPCHMIGKSWLANHGFEEAVTDERLIFCGCLNCHARHDSWFKRLPRESLPGEAWEAAKEHGFRWKLEQEFPEPVPACPNCKRDLDAGICTVCGWEIANRAKGEAA